MKFVYASGARPLDGYTIKRGIGIGGFGEVYFATSDAGKELALKRVQRNMDVEVRGVSQCLNLKHSNLLTLYDIKYDDQGEAWIVMEYIAGDSLKEVLDRNPHGLPLEEVDRWFRGIAAGVAYLHDHGIVHRDLKPGNVFLDQGTVKIGDYGLSKFISCSRRSGQTESVGTFHYMAPEIGKGVYGKEIDIYALGIVLYELLTGTVPFDGESSQEIMMKHLTSEPDLTPIPPPYREVIRRALVKDPEQRFRSVPEMLAALGQAAPASNAPNVGQISNPSPSVGQVSNLSVRVEPPVLASVAAPAGSPGTSNSDEPFYIGDDQPESPEMVFGPLRERPEKAAPPRQSPGRGEPVGAAPLAAAAAAAPANAASPVIDEPVARMVQGLGRRTLDWWNHSNLSTPVKVVVLMGVVLLGIMHVQFLVPAAVVLATAYVLYLGIRLLVGGRSKQSSAPPARPRPASVSKAVSKQVPLRHWEDYARQRLRQKSGPERLMEMTGSMLLAAGVAAVLCLLLMILAGLSVDASVDAWGYFAWMTLTALGGAWLILVLGKFWENTEGENVWRRFAMLVAGLMFGLYAFGMGQYLTVQPTNQMQAVSPVSIEHLPDTMYHADGVPLLPAYLLYFALLLFLLQWWKQADPMRPTRFSLWSTACAVFVAWLLNMFIPFPQPWGLMLAGVMSVAVQLSAPWLSASQRSAMRKEMRTAAVAARAH